METKHNIIRRALEQAPGTQLPEGFCVRLMERLERESERRERRETWLLGTAGVLCLLAVIAGLAWYLWYEPGVGAASARHALTPRHTRVARLGSIQLPEPDFPAESRRLSLFYVFIAATFLALAGLDLCLRKRRHNAAKTNAHPHR